MTVGLTDPRIIDTLPLTSEPTVSERVPSGLTASRSWLPCYSTITSLLLSLSLSCL